MKAGKGKEKEEGRERRKSAEVNVLLSVCNYEFQT